MLRAEVAELLQWGEQADRGALPAEVDLAMEIALREERPAELERAREVLEARPGTLRSGAGRPRGPDARRRNKRTRRAASLGARPQPPTANGRALKTSTTSLIPTRGS